MKQQSAARYIEHGQTPFFRLEPDPTPDAAIVGVPWDASVTYRAGARFAPYELRRVSALTQTFHPAARLDVFEALRVTDGGNVAIAPFDRDQSRALIEHRITQLTNDDVVPFVVGGDHSVALPVLRALHGRYGPLAVVQFDAHLDTSDGETWGDAHHHGTPFRHALRDGLVDRGALVQIGIRASWATAADGDLVQRHDALVVTPDDIDDVGVDRVTAQVVERVGNRPLYVSFDVDAVDPAYAPGVGTPVVGGLTSREALRLLRGLGGCQLVGMDVVEVCPAYDHADVTLHLGAQLLFEGLALLAASRRCS